MLAGMSLPPKRVLFVCTGNTCRSPLAEALFREAVKDRGDYSVGSAGVSATAGTRMSPETAAILKKLGVETRQFASRPVSEKLLAEATHVFAMTRGHLMTLERGYPEHVDKFYLMCEFADLPGKGIGIDVPDPIGMGPAAYHEVCEIFNSVIPALVAYIDQTWKSENGD
jgi:protein-tyrosine-phosphatase